MSERTWLSPTLLNLIVDFEQSLSEGIKTTLDENSFLQIIEYYEEENRLDRALDVTNRAISNFHSTVGFWIKKIELLMRSRRLDDANLAIDEVLRVFPDNLRCELLRAELFACKHDFEVAFDLIAEVKKRACNANEVEIYIAEAVICEIYKDYEQMFQALKYALLLDPTHEKALDLIKTAVDLSRVNNEESILIHSVIVENNPYCSKAWYNLGHAFALVSEYKNAIEALEYSFLVDSEFEDAYRDAAEFCMEIQDFKRAEIILREALIEFEPEYDTLYNLALCQYKIDDIEEAKRTLFSAMQVEPYCEELHFLMAKCDIKDENWMGAINMLEKAIELEDEIEEYFYHLGFVYDSLNKFSKANTFYRKAAFQGEEQSFYWEQYIKFLINSGRFKEAEKYLQQSSEYTYSNRIAYLEVALLSLTDQTEKALQQLCELLQEDVESCSILSEISYDITTNKEIESVIKYYTK